MNPVLISALVAAAVGALGTAVVMLLARRSIRLAAVAAPIVVVVSLATGVAASVQTMAISDSAASTIQLVLAVAAPMAVGVGLLLSRHLGARGRSLPLR